METQTARIIRALDNRYCNIQAHPTGRLIGERPPCVIDMERVMVAAKERGCFPEVNGHPSRLDLDFVQCRAARQMGLILGCFDGRPLDDRAGRNALRRDQAWWGWLEVDDVLNTRPWHELKKLLVR